MSILFLLQQHHGHCDELFAGVEDAVAERQWEWAKEALDLFLGEIERHFCSEEEDLFPAFDAMAGTSMGPTRVMRVEHAQMRELFIRMRDALSRRDAEGYADVAETLLVLMQQHNLKEENILYPMCDRSLTGGGLEDTLRRRLGTSCPA